MSRKPAEREEPEQQQLSLTLPARREDAAAGAERALRPIPHNIVGF